MDVLRFRNLSITARIANNVGRRVAGVFNTSCRFRGRNEDDSVRLRLIFNGVALSQSTSRYQVRVRVIGSSVGIVLSHDAGMTASARNRFSLLINGRRTEHIQIVRARLQAIIRSASSFVTHFVP